jgi:hypothetical protein
MSEKVTSSVWHWFYEEHLVGSSEVFGIVFADDSNADIVFTLVHVTETKM